MVVVFAKICLSSMRAGWVLWWILIGGQMTPTGVGLGVRRLEAVERCTPHMCQVHKGIPRSGVPSTAGYVPIILQFHYGIPRSDGFYTTG